jgi:hypothetical protein
VPVGKENIAAEWEGLKEAARLLSNIATRFFPQASEPRIAREALPDVKRLLKRVEDAVTKIENAINPSGG